MRKTVLFTMLIGLFLFSVLGSQVLAANTFIPDYPDLPEWLGRLHFAGSQRTIGGVVGFILPLAFILAGLGLLVYLIIGGFQLLTSGGNPQKIEGGKKIITNALIGFLIIICAFWISQIVSVITGIEGGTGSQTGSGTCSAECTERARSSVGCRADGDCEYVQIGHTIDCQADGYSCCCGSLFGL